MTIMSVMKKRTLRIAAATLALTALLTACGSKEPEEKYDYSIDMENYEKAISTKDDAYLLLANKKTKLGSSFKPESLTTLPAELTLYGKEIQLESTVALAAEALVRELNACGYKDIRMTSGYRSYEYQQSLFNTYLGQEMAAHPDWSKKKCEELVLTYSALPGTSEHQTGLCIDLISEDHVSLDESFAENPAYEWLIKNAHHFGFILRYPKEKTGITGYAYEPWHYRFVGVKAATEIHEKELTLEEYLD